MDVMIPILRVADTRVAAAWYARLGFEQTGEHQFEPDLPRYAFLRRGDVQIHLSEHTGDARPGTLVYFWVDDVDAVGTEFGLTPEQAPWGREVELTDPDGNRLRVATAG